VLYIDPNKKNQKKKKNKDRIVDASYLQWDIYKALVATLAFLPTFTPDSPGEGIFVN